MRPFKIHLPILLIFQITFFSNTGIQWIYASQTGFGTSCHRLFTNSEGVIQSPNYPHPYPLGLTCVYDISRSGNGNCGIRLTFEYFELEVPDASDGFCKSDWLSIDSCVPEGGARFCGNQTGAIYEYPFEKDADGFRVVFHSNNSTSGGGFVIQYEVMSTCRNGVYWDPPISQIPGAFPSTIPCFTQVTENKGTINSPYYPHNYPHNLDCIYEFIRENPITCGIRMKVLSFDLDDPIQTPIGGACLDFFHTPGCGFLCGKLQFIWTAKFQPGATSLRFHFHSDEEIGRSGFRIGFEQLTDCNSQFPQSHRPTRFHYVWKSNPQLQYLPNKFIIPLNPIPTNLTLSQWTN